MLKIFFKKKKIIYTYKFGEAKTYNGINLNNKLP